MMTLDNVLQDARLMIVRKQRQRESTKGPGTRYPAKTCPYGLSPLARPPILKFPLCLKIVPLAGDQVCNT
jgi:hypothetical protein